MRITDWRSASRSVLLCVCVDAADKRSTFASDPADLIQAILAVGPEGRGNAEATKSWRSLSAGDATTVMPLLQALDTANDLAANWLRSAVETIASRESAQNRKLPLDALEAFVLNRSHQAQPRRLAYDLLAAIEPARAEKLLDGFLGDPAAELRRDAVSRSLDAAGKLISQNQTNQARKAYLDLLPQARDVDQVDDIVKALRKTGETVDVARVFGFLTDWKVIGPFDSTGGKGFAAVYPPETRLDLQSDYSGKSGPVRWEDFTSKEDYGDVSMNLPFKHLKGVAAYAYTVFYADKAGPVELRLGSQNAFKVWLNGQYLFGQNEYHRNKEMDQYPMRADFRAGKNEILVKVCQNEQTEDWADAWDFQLRVCDSQGLPLRSLSPMASQAKSGVEQ